MSILSRQVNGKQTMEVMIPKSELMEPVVTERLRCREEMFGGKGTLAEIGHIFPNKQSFSILAFPWRSEIPKIKY